ncbi:MAG: hypothetical protein ACLFWI_01110 [Coleofasciculus sp.]
MKISRTAGFIGISLMFGKRDRISVDNSLLQQIFWGVACRDRSSQSTG